MIQYPAFGVVEKRMACIQTQQRDVAPGSQRPEPYAWCRQKMHGVDYRKEKHEEKKRNKMKGKIRRDKRHEISHLFETYSTRMKEKRNEKCEV